MLTNEERKEQCRKRDRECKRVARARQKEHYDAKASNQGAAATSVADVRATQGVSRRKGKARATIHSARENDDESEDMYSVGFDEPSLSGHVPGIALSRRTVHAASSDIRLTQDVVNLGVSATDFAVFREHRDQQFVSVLHAIDHIAARMSSIDNTTSRLFEQIERPTETRLTVSELVKLRDQLYTKRAIFYGQYTTVAND